jgi:nitronate monooxygenase
MSSVHVSAVGSRSHGDFIMWPDHRALDLLKIELPIILAPMAGSADADLAIAVAEAGGLGSLPCAMLSVDQTRAAYQIIRQRTSRPINLNFFCHAAPSPDKNRDDAWRARLRPYYKELGLDPDATLAMPNRAPFDDAMCTLIEELKPPVVSFHFGLPPTDLLSRVKETGAIVLSSATTVEEARWLEGEGVDAIIAQGAEAGGHRGMFLSSDIASQVGTFALVPQIVDAVRVPVIAAGGIADARGIVAAFALGASAVQIGTAYLKCPEAKTSAVHRAALAEANDSDTVLTNVITGRPARAIVNRFVREQGPMSEAVPAFPTAVAGSFALRQKAESQNAGDFSPLWAGQASALAPSLPAGQLTKRFADEALSRLRPT